MLQNAVCVLVTTRGLAEPAEPTEIPLCNRIASAFDGVYKMANEVVKYTLLHYFTYRKLKTEMRRMIMRRVQVHDALLLKRDRY